MRAARLGLGALVGTLALAGAVRCAYAPNPPSGQLMCSVGTNQCPEGYGCDNGYGYKNGDLPPSTGQAGASGHAGGSAGASGAAGAGAAGSTGAAGGTGVPCAGSCMIKIDGNLTNANAVTIDRKVIGHWVYTAPSNQVVTCTDTSSKTTSLVNDYVDITAQPGTLDMFNANYFCNWSVVVTGGTTVLKPTGQSCSRNVTDPKTGVTKFTWHGVTFTFNTTDGKTGTLTSMINVDYVDDSSKTGCTP